LLSVFHAPRGTANLSAAGHLKRGDMKGFVLWLFGVPLSVIVLLYLFGIL